MSSVNSELSEPPKGTREEDADQSARPSENACVQQQLRAWQPTYGSIGSILCFVLVAAGFIPTGAMMLVAHREDLVSVDIRYDDLEEIRECPWVRTDSSFERCYETCTEAKRLVNAECSQQKKCGQIANLGPNCPRNVSDLQYHEYANLEGCDPHCNTSVTFTVTETLNAPVYFYYKLDKFYQNHRNFVESRSQNQLAGWSTYDGEFCNPLLKVGDKTEDDYCHRSTNGEVTECEYLPFGYCPLDSGCNMQAPVVNQLGDFRYAPCGLSAWAMFNDSLILKNSDGDIICDGDAFAVDGSVKTGRQSGNCRKTGIAWSADKYKNFDTPHRDPKFLTAEGLRAEFENCESVNWEIPRGCTLDPSSHSKIVMPHLMNGWYAFEPYHKIPTQTDEDFIVWSKIAILPKFQKLYRIIDVDIPPGVYTMDIKHRFDVHHFGGKKSFVLATTAWTGGSAHFLAILYITLGSLSFVFAVVFMVHHALTVHKRAHILEHWIEEAQKRSWKYVTRADLRGTGLISSVDEAGSRRFSIVGN
eukprot:TRINITY_DN4796_c0_g1_i1.p1 TRINITY_DN4796_c0_g1~~TRINITY_DN4796_c0_g1_i1.p1  ORF type:complete len:542 (+),score=74.92 TRINITY_DN4796_c0_g1_i1:38-1627(+)